MSTMTPEIQALGDDFRGELIHPGEPSYDEHRDSLERVDRPPALR